jgi:hypothetical protein
MSVQRVSISPHEAEVLTAVNTIQAGEYRELRW